jgi:hypothetical protein
MPPGETEGRRVVGTDDSLAAIEEIKQLKARYFRFLDCKDWDGLEHVFAPDAVMDVSDAVDDMPPESRAAMSDDGGFIRGRGPIADFVRGVLADAVTVHHGHMPEIEVRSPSSAAGVWAMEDTIAFAEGSPIRSLHGYGHYHETYVREDGEWLISSLRLTRLRVDTELA